MKSSKRPVRVVEAGNAKPLPCEPPLPIVCLLAPFKFETAVVPVRTKIEFEAYSGMKGPVHRAGHTNHWNMTVSLPLYSLEAIIHE